MIADIVKAKDVDAWILANFKAGISVEAVAQTCFDNTTKETRQLARALANYGFRFSEVLSMLNFLDESIRHRDRRQ